MKTTILPILMYFAISQMAAAQTSFLDLDAAPTPAAPEAAAPAGASGKMVCTSGSKVTLSKIATNSELAANLKAFMNGVEFKEGDIYVRNLSGYRKDPGACAGFIGSIDLAGCQKYKPAGESRFQVVNGEVQYLADGRTDLIPITLKKLCSDGVNKMTFQFHYDQQFLTVHAGPWDYTISVFKQNGQAYSNISAVVLDNGTRVSLNKKPIAVGPVEITSNGRRRPSISADDVGATASGAVR